MRRVLPSSKTQLERGERKFSIAKAQPQVKDRFSLHLSDQVASLSFLAPTAPTVSWFDP